MTQEKPYRWYLPENARSAADTIEDIKMITRFFIDTLTQQAPGEEFFLTEDGAAGLYYLLSFIEDTLDECNNKLLQEVKA